MANQWFRMYSEFATDQKVQMMNEVDQRRLTMLFCLRCNGNVTLHDEEVAFLLRISNDEWQKTKELFVTKGFINEANEVLNWDKRQFTSDSSAERVARHRAKKKRTCNVTVTPPDTDTDTDTEIKNKKQKSVADAPPDPADSEKKKAASKQAGMVMLVNAGVSEQTAKDFLEVRKAKRAPITQTALDEIVKQAAIAGLAVEDAVKICVRKNWQGFNASWDWGQMPPNQKYFTTPERKYKVLN